MSHVVIPSTNIFIVRGSRVLLGRRANTGWMDGKLCPPGGHIEPGETPTVAAIREIAEELGVTVTPEDLTFLCVAARNTGEREYVAYEFVIRDKDYPFQNAEPGKCTEIVWAELDRLPDDVVDQFREIIVQSVIGGEPYLELGYNA